MLKMLNVCYIRFLPHFCPNVLVSFTPLPTNIIEENIPPPRNCKINGPGRVGVGVWWIGIAETKPIQPSLA